MISESREKNKPKKFPNLTIKNLAKFFAEDIRLYREGKFPFIGKSYALKKIEEERVNFNNGKVLSDKCESSEDFRYCYGEIEKTNKNRSTEKGNSLQIWKFRNGKWRMVLDLYAPIPTENK